MSEKLVAQGEKLKKIGKNLAKRPKVSSVLIKAGFTKEMVERKVANVLLMNAKETQDMRNDKDTCNFDLILLAVVEAAQRTADTARLDNLLEKIFGKTVNIQGSVSVHNTNMDIPIGYADQELIRRAIERSIKNTA